ncbi:MAG: RecX family transcriptional regulator [Bacteroidales bacterium]|nr:RecX family transcriptional regulator [Bacteroidales bacterium]
MTHTEILSKLERYCAYQDRCTSDVISKLKTLQIDEELQNDIVKYLKIEGFIDDERFVQSFIRGKLSTRQWGPNKIRMHLLQKKINNSLIDKYLQDIDKVKLQANLQVAIEKWKRLHGEINKENLPKLFRHLLSKGFGYEDIKGMVKVDL